MAGFEARTKGALVDGRGPGVVRSVFRSWLQGALRSMQRFAKSIAPFLTGTYRRSLIFRTYSRATEIFGTFYSTDVPGKVGTIEYGFPAKPLKRQPKKGPVRMGKGRKGVFVFRRAEQHTRGLFRTQSRVLETTLAKELTR